jgi:hypothetical protein
MSGARRQADRAGHEPSQSPLSRPDGDHPSRGACRYGHPNTTENTQRIGKAGYRCKECRRKIARESARKMRTLDPQRIRENARRANAAYYARIKARGEQGQ